MPRLALAPVLTLALLTAAATASAGPYASIRELAGELEIERAAGDGWERATRNHPVAPGDRLETSADGRAELVLPDGSLLWLDRATSLDVLALEPAPLLRLGRGALALEVDGPGGGEDAAVPRVDARAGSLFALDRGRYRAGVSRDGLLRVTVESGLAEVRGGGSSVLVRAGERTSVWEDDEPETPWVYNTASRDEFDDWIDARRHLNDVVVSYRDDELDLPPVVRPYRYELETLGSWHWHGPFNRYVWRPAVRAGWRPWVDGRWVWYPDGATWVSGEPWGWVTYHYGAWDWDAGIGWFWVPGRTYAPAWVDWFVYDHYVAWCPARSYSYLDHHGHRHHRRLEVRHDRISHPPSQGTVVVARDRLFGGLLRDAIVPSDRVRAFAPRIVRDRLEPADVGLPAAARPGAGPALPAPSGPPSAPAPSPPDRGRSSGSGPVARPERDPDVIRREPGGGRLRDRPGAAVSDGGASAARPGAAAGDAPRPGAQGARADKPGIGRSRRTAEDRFLRRAEREGRDEASDERGADDARRRWPAFGRDDAGRGSRSFDRPGEERRALPRAERSRGDADATPRPPTAPELLRRRVESRRERLEREHGEVERDERGATRSAPGQPHTRVEREPPGREAPHLERREAPTRERSGVRTPAPRGHERPHLEPRERAPAPASPGARRERPSRRDTPSRSGRSRGRERD